jgi:predicted acylesterase/phospholipase RssA
MRALAEAGVPVDAVGGTSMGAALAAQRAMEWDPDRIAAANRRVFVEIQPHKRFTVPVFSLVTNELAVKCGKWLYGEADIEDLWIPFYCVSSNLATAEAYVHTRGPVWKATLASASLPAFAPPIIEGTHLLVDGGLLANVPVDAMRAKGCGVVIASQVTMNEDASFAAERVPTAWEAFSGRLRRRPPLRFPTLLEVAFRSTMLQSTFRARQAVEDADFCLYPPIDRFGLMDFPLLPEIVQAGYEHGREALAAWTERPQTPAGHVVAE